MVSAYASGAVVLRNVERLQDPELVLYGVPRSEALTIFELVMSGRIDEARARDWVEEWALRRPLALRSVPGD